MQRKSLFQVLSLAAATCVLGIGANAAWAAIIIDTVPVGNAGNVADTQVMGDGTTGYGRVTYNYNIGKYDVTAAQYTAFLNAVANSTDPNGLYYPFMATDTQYGCGIIRTGQVYSWHYSTTKNGNFPVNYVSLGDAMRFANWLQNGQPTGAQGPSTTEDGVYFLNGAYSDADLQAVSRKSNWKWAVTSENEWYKAAYYDPNKNGVGNAGYWMYPTKSDTPPSNVMSATGTNNANYFDRYGHDNGGYTDPVNYLTAVGTFAASPSPYGTFDQGGDVWNWNEAIRGLYRGQRGGSVISNIGTLRADYRNSDYPTYQHYSIGFRVSQVPEPTSFGILGLCVGWMLTRRRGAGR